MKNTFRLYRRSNGMYHWQEADTTNQGSPRTKDKRQAEKLLHAKNEAVREPSLNLSITRAYLAARSEDGRPKLALSSA